MTAEGFSIVELRGMVWFRQLYADIFVKEDEFIRAGQNV